MDLNARIGETARRIRTAKGVSLRDVAEVAKVGASFLAQLERGERTWNAGLLESVAPALGVSARELLPDAEVGQTPDAMHEDLNILRAYRRGGMPGLLAYAVGMERKSARAQGVDEVVDVVLPATRELLRMRRPGESLFDAWTRMRDKPRPGWADWSGETWGLVLRAAEALE